MMPNIVVSGTGSYVPDKVLTNEELVKTLALDGIQSSDEWIVSHTGIRERRIADKSESTSGLGAIAAARALEGANLEADEVDLIVCATSTPDMYLPSTACLIQGKLGASKAVALDVNAACSGFIYALATAYYFLKAGKHRNALVIGAETYSRILNWKDRSTCVFFGDGAGAVVLQKSTQKGICEIYLGADGSNGESIHAHACGIASHDEESNTRGIGGKFWMNGRQVYDFAIEAFPFAVNTLLEKLGYTVEDIDLLISHQANINIIRSSLVTLGLPETKAFINVEKYGNTAAASIPLALDEAVKAGLAKEGANVVLVGFGGGLTWGSTLIRF